MLVTFDDITELASRSRELVYMLGVVRESRDKIKEQNEELRFLATRDPLIGCFNRRSFFEQFENAWKAESSLAPQVGVIMVDIDRFKSINDGHGHATGDEVLRSVAGVLLESNSRESYVCRYGGEEFAILLAETTLEATEIEAERMRMLISSAPIRNLKITVSLGVSHSELGAASPQMLLDQADQALYFSKRNGRDRVSRFDKLPEGMLFRADHAKAENAAAQALEIKSPQSEAASSVPYQAVSSLLSALAFRDPETAAHCMRVADYSVAASRGLMSAGDAYLLEIGALLHDVGKIGVPDAVLLKPGPLTKDEWQVMQTHDRIGVEIVNSSFTCLELTELIRCHHSWYSKSERGEGLPTGEGIPLGARLISIADAYDAMVSDRVYRKGRPQAEAFIELRKMAGIQFDPRLVERFIEVMSQRAPRREESHSADKEVTLNLCLQTERMARAVDERDFASIRALAQHLESTAAKSELSVMHELAIEIGRVANDPAELPQLVELVHDLMELCLATQRACLAQDKESAPRG